MTIIIVQSVDFVRPSEHSSYVLGKIGGWDSEHVSDGLQVGWIVASHIYFISWAYLNLSCILRRPLEGFPSHH